MQQRHELSIHVAVIEAADEIGAGFGDLADLVEVVGGDAAT